MNTRSLLFLMFIPVCAFADSPFTGAWKLKDPDFIHPNSKEAQYRAIEDLLGIKHFGFLLHVQPETQTYAVRLQVPSADGEKRVLKEILMTTGASPVGLGVSALPTGDSVKLKLYTSSEESLHTIDSDGKNVHIERGAGDDGTLLRCVEGDNEIFTVTWTKLAEQAGSEQPATRPESKPEDGEKPQPESEGRSR